VSWTQTFAEHYAAGLLGDSSSDCQRFLSNLKLDHPALSWRRCGALSQTGFAESAGIMSPAPLSACADGALAALYYLTSKTFVDHSNLLESVRGSILLGERAQYTEWKRAGNVTLGGVCRLIESADNHVAINLPREDDWSLAQAWLEQELSDWNEVESLVRNKRNKDLIERARLLGLAVSKVEPMLNSNKLPLFEQALPEEKKAPLVLDLSALWAGPLAASLLQLSGARVIKVESEQRFDGAREGNQEFYELLNQGKESLLLDFKSESGITALRKLIDQADIVIESSRPRALKQLGIDAEDCVANKPALVWLSITAYGRSTPQADWIGFGDDVGVAAGLTSLLHQRTGEMIFCGDAIADPLTGVHAALLACQQYLSGQGVVLDVAMHSVVRHCIESNADHRSDNEYSAWTAMANADQEDYYPLRDVYASAAEAGEQTQKLLREFDLN